MKTIFITSFNPFATRNVLGSDAFRLLKIRTDLRLVIFCPDYKKDYFEKQFGVPNVVIEGIPAEQISRQDIFLTYVARSIISTSTLSLHRKEIFYRNKNLLNFLISYLLSFFGYFKPIRKLIRILDRLTAKRGKFSSYFDIYRPDLVLALDVFHVDDVHFLMEARRRRIFTIGMVRSWDNITGKGLFRVKPDKLIVNNDIIKDEALVYGDMKEKDIFVSGFPQFDFYTRYQPKTREKLFQELGLNPAKKTILVAPHGSRFFKYDWQIFKIFKEMPYQFILRLPPNDKIDFKDFQPDSRFYVEHPGIVFEEGVYRDRELTDQDGIRLADELASCDLMISYGSTVILDASLFDKPVILIAFDGWEKQPYIQSEQRYLNYAHMAKMLETGCCWIADSKESLREGIASYLKNPALHRENRKRLASEWSFKLDGQSGKRIAEFVLNNLKV